LSTQAGHTSSTITFKGMSGERYCFQAWPIDTKFKAIGGVYIVTKRACEDRTFPTKASHRPLAIGQTSDLSTALVTASERAKLGAQGANCVCVCAVADEARRVEIEKDLIDGNEQWGGRLHYLFHPDVPEKAPGVPPPL
jgi:hypothetical protein